MTDRLKAIFDQKLATVNECRDAWPAYARNGEDCELRRNHWNEKYGKKRLVFHDDTNINLKFQPSSAELQSLTYSDYYSGNCAKGGVSVQPCSWIRVYDLFTGGASDTYYLTKCGAMEEQEEFAEMDLVEDGTATISVPFTNVLDKHNLLNSKKVKRVLKILYVENILLHRRFSAPSEDLRNQPWRRITPPL